MSESNITITPEQFQSLLAEAVKIGRTPVVDPRELSRQKTLAQAKAQSAKGAHNRASLEQSRCGHRRMYRHQWYPRVAWMRNADGVWCGVCQICGKIFRPETVTEAEYAKVFSETYDAQTAGSAATNQSAAENRRRAQAASKK